MSDICPRYRDKQTLGTLGILLKHTLLPGTAHALYAFEQERYRSKKAKWLAENIQKLALAELGRKLKAHASIEACSHLMSRD